jgi:hypothetical protein
VEPGDLVLAYDETLGQTSLYTVTAALVYLDSVIVTLKVDDEVIVTTPEHPFYTMAGEWVPAGELQVDEQLRRADGTYGSVEAVDVTTQPQLMYNLTVADVHTYFIGNGMYLVHNQCPYSVGQLRASSQVLDRNGLTRAGRALQKHSSRSGSPWTPYAPQSGRTATNYNTQADNLVQDLLTDPATTVTVRPHFRHGTIYDFRASDGRGIRFDNAGNFIGFLD